MKTFIYTVIFVAVFGGIIGAFVHGFTGFFIGFAVGAGAGIVFYPLILLKEKTVDRAIYAVADKVEDAVTGNNKSLLAEMFDTLLIFETDIGIETIVEYVLAKYNTIDSKTWSCQRQENILFFVIGVESIEYAETANVPFLAAQLTLSSFADGTSKAAFAFTERCDTSTGSCPFVHEMAAILDDMQNTFKHLDRRVIITKERVTK